MEGLNQYLAALRHELASGKATEHSFRHALKAFIECQRPGIAATNEPRGVACGAPDFIVTEGAVILGHIECKDIGKNLDEIERSDQIKRYLDGLPNLILTDYLQFRLYQSGNYVASARIAKRTAKDKLKKESAGEAALDELLTAFFAADMPTIGTPRELADRMAGLARNMRAMITRIFEKEDEAHGSLHSQLDAFKKVLLHDLEPPGFADMYAQTICYGLFAARCNHKPAAGPFTRQTAAYDLPETNPFLREMFNQIAGPGLDTRLTWLVDELAQLLERADIGEILRDFGRRTRQEDPVVHFYETFLASYDPNLRETRGVYYTPEPVVSYIVRSIDHILRTDFGMADGLATSDKTKVAVPASKNGAVGKGKITETREFHRVLILDPATGTGTFLHGVIAHIYEQIVRMSGEGAWDGYVSKHLLPRVFGFELLMAPYAVAHMKLGIQLAETGYSFNSGERLRVYLTNTLEEAFATGALPIFAQKIAEEANAAGHIKQTFPVMVVLGNPPYSGLSANMNKWSDKMLKTRLPGENGAQSYYTIDRKALREKKVWLQDDYVKFFRFAQWRIEQTGYGILAFISNHGYLDNPTFRGMRQSLMQTFDQIYVLDLHGNTRKREKTPDGSKDENVFDIQQGVAIGIFVRHQDHKPHTQAEVFHAELWGMREVWSKQGSDHVLSGGKYHYLANQELATTEWERLAPCTPFYMFKPQEGKFADEYSSYTKVSELFAQNTSGILTARDRFALDFTKSELLQRIEMFLSSPESGDALLSQFGLKENYSWRVDKARADVRKDLKHRALQSWVEPVLYRPFDIRKVFYHPAITWRPRSQVMRHMLAGENVGLITTRLTKDKWDALCTENIIAHKSLSAYDISYLFPLYLYVPKASEAEDIESMSEAHEAAASGVIRRANFELKFIKGLSEHLGLSFRLDGRGDLKTDFGPEDVFHYIYAILHSPTYRERYAEFLKMDFPRIPFTSDTKLFGTLAALGARLVRLHLLKDVPESEVRFPLPGNGTVERPEYSETQRRVYINKDQYFENVPAEVWNFHVGGYQVCEKWLKDRKGRQLSYEDITHYIKIVSALGETIEVMRQIDATIPEWPLPDCLEMPPENGVS